MATKAEATTGHGFDPMHAEPIGHGNSVAAWTAVGIMLIGALLGCVGFAITNVPLLAVGSVVVILGLVAGWFMKKIGYGVGGSKSKDNGH
ncbi:HGxxPAAW family protein [Arthrobacter sp. KK5.5]|uniref:HGxxPAAW family protein n=1 Tax=Arthrobacter sp. KK5.5 TaxID=3373084 RepID=UPI003EE53EDE